MTIAISTPLFDLSEFTEGSPIARRRFANDIAQACAEQGFFMITNHGVAQQLLDEATALAKTFFDLPFAEKKASLIRAGAGFVPLPEEEDDDAICGPKEAFNLLKGKMDGRWPVRPEGLKETLLAYEQEMERLSGTLMRVFALGLGLPEEAFADKFNEGVSFLRIVNYPNQLSPPPEGQLRCEPHTDLGTLTILSLEDQPGGLQIFARDGGCLEVRVRPGYLLIIIGDEMKNWTNNLWHPPVHRVVNKPSEQRMNTRRLSLLYFCNPDSIRERVDAYMRGEV